jgi:hypothetical protein
MAVLPSSATLPSFFVVFIIFLLVTVIAATNMSILRHIAGGLHRSHALIKIITTPFIPAKNYIGRYIVMLTPTLEETLRDHFQRRKQEYLFILFRCWIPQTTQEILRLFLIPEIVLPCRLINVFLLRHNPYLIFWWSPVLLVWHIIRFAFIPIWLAIALVMILYLMFLDFCSVCVHAFGE